MVLHILTTAGLVVCIVAAVVSWVMAAVTRDPGFMAAGIIGTLCSLVQYQQWSVLP